MAECIKFCNITKVFTGQVALEDVSFRVEKGEVHALLGENGAGKSTLLNILHGVFPATSGTVMIDGKDVSFHDVGSAIKFGIAKVHQEINVIPELSVAENLMLGSEIAKNGFIDKKAMYEQTQKILDRLNVDFVASDRIGSLSAGQKQMAAIAKAIHLNARIISFDEPTASLSDGEVATLFGIIKELKSNGITILYISHKLDEIFKICDRATILRDGKYITTMDIANTDKDTLIRSMVGRDVSMFAKRVLPTCAKTDKTVLKVCGVSGADFSDVSFELYDGEILGFFGLVGAGRTQTMRAIFGADALSSGSIELNGRRFKSKSPNDCVKSGIALISENRKEEGFAGNFDNMDNMALPCLHKFKDGLFINTKKKYANAVQKGKQVGLYPNDPEFMTARLSGGNAQKVILAKWLSTDSQIMIFDEPTKGIDIGAKAEIYRLMEELLKQRKSIIMISSELTEVMGMSDRIIVMREGRVVAEVQKDEFSEERLLSYAVESK